MTTTAALAVPRGPSGSVGPGGRVVQIDSVNVWTPSETRAFLVVRQLA